MNITDAERQDIELTMIRDIPDGVTKEIVIRMIHRMYEASQEHGNYMSDLNKDPAEMMEEAIEENIDSLCYNMMGLYALKSPGK